MTQKYLRQAQQNLRQTKLQALTLREQHLEDRVTLANIQGDRQKARAVQTIKRIENLQRIYRKLRNVTKRHSQ